MSGKLGHPPGNMPKEDLLRWSDAWAKLCAAYDAVEMSTSEVECRGATVAYLDGIEWWRENFMPPVTHPHTDQFDNRRKADA